MSFDSQITSVEEDMRLLRIEFDRFLAGAVRHPPEELRFRIEKRIRAMRRARIRSSVERFRLGTLEASFNTLSERQGRRLRELESSKTLRRKTVTSEPRLDTDRGFEIGAKPDRSAMEALYESLYGDSGRASKVDFGSFEKHVTKQIARLQKKTGCAKVHLRVAREGETLKLKAKPVRKNKQTTG